MAIKVGGTTVIDDSRNIQNVGIISATTISATTITGDGSGLTGAGSTVVDDTTTDQLFYPLFTSTTSGTVTASKVSTSKFSFNPSSGILSVTSFYGDGSGLTGVDVDPFFVIPTRTGTAVTFYAGDNNLTIGARSGDFTITV
jgi:hypothetical protein